jgi:CheY-like chemotaxis protein
MSPLEKCEASAFLTETPMRILVADDVRMVGEVIARLCQRNGCQAYLCDSGQQVLPLLQCVRPDVLLLDIAMPDMDGLQVAAELKAQPDLRPPLVVAVTGYGDPVMHRKIMDAGFDHHLVKPVGWRELSAVIKPTCAIH